VWDRTYGALLCQSKSLATALAQRGIERCGNGADAEVRKAWVGARIYRPSVYTRRGLALVYTDRRYILGAGMGLTRRFGRRGLALVYTDRRYILGRC